MTKEEFIELIVEDIKTHGPIWQALKQQLIFEELTQIGQEIGGYDPTP